MKRHTVWKTASVDFKVCGKGNVLNLGGLSLTSGNGLLGKPSVKGSEPLGAAYLNSTFCNCLKVLLGFCPAFFSFMYTQNWWFLAWFGTFIWFGITGVRNVVQMVMRKLASLIKDVNGAVAVQRDRLEDTSAAMFHSLSSLPMVVLSPPGMIRASMPSISLSWRTSRAVAPRRATAAT